MAQVGKLVQRHPSLPRKIEAACIAALPRENLHYVAVAAAIMPFVAAGDLVRRSNRIDVDRRVVMATPRQAQFRFILYRRITFWA
ncbi:hypothetical protein [Qipengyuania sp. SM2507]